MEPLSIITLLALTTITFFVWKATMSRILKKLQEQHALRNPNPNNYKFLFVIKERSVYGTKTKAYGLFNSCKFVCNRLRSKDIQADVVQVIDNNCIDKYVSEYKPTHCFIEALWVVPSKFEVLAKLHPNVKWVVRLHSMVPFLTSEGMAFEWLNEYIELRKKGINISISCNNREMYEELSHIYGDAVSCTPNIYDPGYEFSKVNTSKDILDIGCFGALRVLKNHTQQALWAIEFADKINKKMNFHVNISEHEQREAGPVLRNLRAIFKNTTHSLVEHPWYEHKDFLELVSTMDIGMQISYTESFNVVAADFVQCGVPIVVSRDIKFVHPNCCVSPSNDKQIEAAMKYAYCDRRVAEENKKLLEDHNRMAFQQWLEYIRN
jgi:hypothetical protein